MLHFPLLEIQVIEKCKMAKPKAADNLTAWSLPHFSKNFTTDLAYAFP